MCELVELATAITNHRYIVDMCALINTGPITSGNTLRIKCSTGWQ